MQPEIKNCVNCTKDFTIEEEDFSFYKKIDVPAPTHCPECRLQRRLAFRNERTFYKRSCDLCQKDVISSYSQDVSFPVYCHGCWWSDKWNAHDYGRDIDFSQSFFTQLKELQSVVPRIAIVNDNGVASVNCEYTYDFFYSKNSYLCVGAWEFENAMYLYFGGYGKDIVDCFSLYHSEMCYECVRVEHSARCAFCTLCYNCTDCTLCYDMRGCTDCIMSTGLRNKKYHIKNVQYTKEEYEQKKAEMNLTSRKSLQQLKSEFKEMVKLFPKRYMYAVKTVDSTGNMLTGCKNSKNIFFQLNTEDSKYSYFGEAMKHCYDQYMTGRAEMAYECNVADESYGTMFGTFCLKGKNVHYSDYCHSGNELLGCIGMKKAEYSILNKRYSKEEYEELYRKIKEHMLQLGEWGEFFPMSLSPFPYNESAAYDRFYIDKEQVESRGLVWRDREPRDYTPDFSAGNIPDDITLVTESLANKILACCNQGSAGHGKCTTAFRILEAEVNVYQKLGIPLPDKCPNCRYYERLLGMNTMKMWKRTTEDGVEVMTSYSPDQPDKIYSEAGYNNLIN